MNLTDEQQLGLDTVLKTTDKIVAISAVSGAGKTSLLVAIDKALKPKTGLYIAYNKAIATEASRKFSKSVRCMTTHSLAYGNTVRAFSLKVGHFTYRNIEEKVPYDVKLTIVNYIELFCLSKHTDIDDFQKDQELPAAQFTLVKQYLNKMQEGEIEVPHSFYLKFYHILLAKGHIVHNEFDLLLLDEAGDLNPVTLEIFKLIPAKHKVMVGDENQNIYSFNNTINGFESLKEKILLPMTQSFRVSAHIAPYVEKFCQEQMNPDFVFRGVPYSDYTISTEAFISRTNGVLISKMIELDDARIPYNLVRPPLQIFKLPLTVLGLKPKGFVSPEFRHYQDATNTFYSDKALQHQFKTLFPFLLDYFNDDVNLRSAINTIIKHGASAVMSAYASAKSHVGTNYPLTLCTAHSSKGLEFDKVTLGDDCNTVLDKFILIPKDKRTNEEQEEMRLYYVSCTRTRKKLENARHLSLPTKDTSCQDSLNL